MTFGPLRLSWVFLSNYVPFCQISSVPCGPNFSLPLKNGVNLVTYKNVLCFPEGYESRFFTPDLLQQVMQTLYPRENCSTLYNPYSDVLKFTDDMICVGRGIDANGLCNVCICEMLIKWIPEKTNLSFGVETTCGSSHFDNFDLEYLE